MENTKLKLMIVCLIFILGIIVSTSVFASNEGIQILKTSGAEYMIYISEHLDESFEFTFTNEKQVNKEELNYKVAATDTANKNSNYIAYVDEKLYDTYFDTTVYLWARTLDGEYFVEGVEIDLKNSTNEAEVELANNITKMIEVDTTNTITTTEMKDGVKVTKTVGKVDVLEKGKTTYQLVRLPSSDDYNEFMKVAEKIAYNQVEDNMYAKLETTRKFADLYNKLVPAVSDEKWLDVEESVILQPEEAKNDEQYILWLKTENEDETKLDAQFLTCFEDYKPEVISEKVVTKLPVTADDPTLFMILAALIVAFIIVLTIRTISKTKTSKH